MRVVARSWSRRSSLSGTADRLPDFPKVKQVTSDQFLASRTNDPDRGWTGTPWVTAVPPESKRREFSGLATQARRLSYRAQFRLSVPRHLRPPIPRSDLR